MAAESLNLDDLRLDGGTQVRAEINSDVVEDYAAALLAGTAFPPVTVFYDGDCYWLADGFHRVAACQMAGMPAVGVEIRVGSRREAVLYACGANTAHGLRRTNADKRRAVDTLLRDPEWAQWSDREIARRCGVSDWLARDMRGELSASSSQIPAPTARLVERGGTVYTQQTAGINGSRDGGDGHAPAPDRLAVHYSSASVEHYTPAHVIDLVLRVLGAIDLDPCSNSHEMPNVPAARHYTREDDGLAQPWAGRVYMNPPYGDEIGAWVDKLVREYETGNVTEAIALLPARTDTRWFEQIAGADLCFVRGRLRFSDNANAAPFPSMLAFLGENRGQFGATFEALGSVWVRGWR